MFIFIGNYDTLCNRIKRDIINDEIFKEMKDEVLNTESSSEIYAS